MSVKPLPVEVVHGVAVGARTGGHREETAPSVQGILQYAAIIIFLIAWEHKEGIIMIIHSLSGAGLWRLTYRGLAYGD